MDNQAYQEFIKSKQFIDVAGGFDVPDSDINHTLFDFQRVVTKWALARGRAAIFEDTGLGKTFQQCEWAHHVHRITGRNVLIFAPLCVAHQTVQEAAKLNIHVHYCREQSAVECGINITNYEMLEHFDMDEFGGVVLDESSILKHQDSKTRTKIISSTRSIPYKLSCTATPSPNDYMELGNQAEFLGIMTAVEMLAMFFIHDGSDTSKWRLKGHGQRKFWEWMSTWSVCIRKPSDLGFSDDGYDLPALNIHHHVIESGQQLEGQLFMVPAQTLMERRQAARQTIELRIQEAARIANASDEQFIVWCNLNDESNGLATAITGSNDVKGSDSIDRKEKVIDSFTDGDLRVLVTKPSICGFGMNWQHCQNMIFVGLNDSFEQYYQAVRRCWRYGQKSEVNVHLISADIEGNVKKNIERKEKQADSMANEMVIHMRDLMRKKIMKAGIEKTEYSRDKAEGDRWTLHLGDCVDVAGEMDDESIDYTIFSPPFSSLYTYSNSDYDMGNCRDDSEFFGQFKFLVSEMFRITKPGRLLSFHCMNLPTTKQNHGYIGLRDFRGEMIRMYIEAGWIYHSEVCIWKDPVTAMQRTKALGLLYKQIKKDSAMSRMGIPDYVVTMRKPGENPDPITHTPDSFPVNVWQRYASPIWMDINQSKTLQFRDARDNDDERHICPLQLDVISRCVELWSNPGDLVFSPFAGIGSEGFVSVQLGRRFVGSELKPSYFELAKKNMEQAKQLQDALF